MYLQYEFGEYEVKDDRVLKELKRIYSSESKTDNEQLIEVIENVLSAEQIESWVKISGYSTLQEMVSECEIEPYEIICELNEDDINEIKSIFEDEAYKYAN